MLNAVRDVPPQVNDICAGLFSRGDGMTFHWAILVPHSPGMAHKLNAVDYIPGDWHYALEEQSLANRPGILPPLVITVKLGSLDETDTPFDSFEKVLRALPIGEKPPDEERFSCRTWFKMAVRELDDLGILTCSEVGKLEKELTHLAMLQEASENRPIPGHFVSAHSE